MKQSTLVVPRVTPHADLQAALDRSSYEWLAANESVVLAAVEREIAAGARPQDLRLFVIREYGREDIAARIEQAARHIASVNNHA